MTSDQQTAIDKVRTIMAKQYSGSVPDAQKAYDWLRGWCDGKGYDFALVFDWALDRLRKTEAISLHSTLALAGHRLQSRMR